MSGVITRTRFAIFLAAALVATVAIFGLTQGLGTASVPDDAVAVVDADITIEPAGIVDGEISKEGFDRALEQAALRQGQNQVPEPDSEQYEPIRDQALGDLLDIAWIKGEADERGIEASEREVRDEFEQTKDQSFENEQEYQQFLEQSGFNQEDVDLRIELQILSRKIQEKIEDDAGEATREDAEKYYEANKETFAQPEQRDVRVIVNEDESKVEQALSQLEGDDSDQVWNRVAKNLSTDPGSRNNGGLRESVTEGVLPEAVDSEVFEAEEGELIGPIETPGGSYVFQVQSVTEATTQPFDDVADQIQQQLTGQIQQEDFTRFLDSYRSTWINLTVCAEDYLSERCDNFTIPQAECTEDQLAQTGCPPPVLSTSPGAPGSFLPFTPPSGQPQRPHPPGDDADAPAVPEIPGIPGDLPPGATPGG